LERDKPEEEASCCDSDKDTVERQGSAISQWGIVIACFEARVQT